MRKFEYYHEHIFETFDLIDYLNRMGNEGWELVHTHYKLIKEENVNYKGDNIIKELDQYYFIFKREVQ